VRETVANEYRTWRPDAPAPAATAEFAAGISAVSQIVWGEHCSECDYPRCYSTCGFYDPRPDLNCRRFVGGIEAAPGGLTRIRFRRWGKLEGHGPAPLWPLSQARRRQARDEAISRTLAGIPAPFAVHRRLADRRNSAKTRPPRGPAIVPDAFVVEGWSGDGVERQFTLTFLQDTPERTMFQTAFLLTGECSRLVVPLAKIAASIDLASPYLIQIEPVGEAEGVCAIFTLTDFVAVAAAVEPPADKERPLVKVVVWDLDETLWRGILAEDGAGRLEARPEAVAAIKALDAKGVLHSIASKNDETEAMAALRAFGLDDYFLHPQIGWGPKSVAVARIASALDLALDSFAFIDDQAFERAEVSTAHPSVRGLPETSIADLVDHPWFDHPITAESAGRRSLYRAEARRKEAAAGDYDYLGFLRGAELIVSVAPLGPDDVERVFELSQRTNQLNFTGAKLTRDAVLAMLSPDETRRRLTLRCADRFGDYGLIGFADLDLAAGELSAFFMSCRVQRKRVEHAAFTHFADLLRQAGHRAFRVSFRPTARNAAAARLLRELGFRQGDLDSEGSAPWERPQGRPFEDSDIVRVSLSPIGSG
jgi:FkbH-like protein